MSAITDSERETMRDCIRERDRLIITAAEQEKVLAKTLLEIDQLGTTKLANKFEVSRGYVQHQERIVRGEETQPDVAL